MPILFQVPCENLDGMLGFQSRRFYSQQMMFSVHFKCAKVQRSCEFVPNNATQFLSGYIWFIRILRAKVSISSHHGPARPSCFKATPCFKPATGSDKALPEVQKATMPAVGLRLDGS